MKIRKRKNPSGDTVWILDLGRGKGQRKTYPSKTKAQTALDQEERRREKHGEILNGISPAQIAEFVSCQNRLIEAGASIAEATEFYLGHGKFMRSPLLVPDLVERFRDSRKKKNLSEEYVSQLGTSLGHLSKAFPLKFSHELTAPDIANWIESGGWGPKTRNNYLGDVSAMFEWAILPTQGHARLNPCVGVERAEKKRRGKTSCLTVGQAEQMLRAAQEKGNWRVLMYLVLGMLGGIRPEEMTRPDPSRWLLWSDVSLDEHTVHLSEEVVKTGPGRVVYLTDAAVEWLSLIPEELRTGKVINPRNWQEVWRRFRYDLGWRVATEKEIRKYCYPTVKAIHGEWPKDVLRHTFASMHLAHHQDENKLQIQMGHASRKMIQEHYLAVKTRKEASEFWNLAPMTAHKSITAPAQSASKELE